MTSGDSTRCTDGCGKACAGGDKIAAATKRERIVAVFDIVSFPRADVGFQVARNTPTLQYFACATNAG
jgi:hypothetical protein